MHPIEKYFKKSCRSQGDLCTRIMALTLVFYDEIDNLLALRVN